MNDTWEQTDANLAVLETLLNDVHMSGTLAEVRDDPVRQKELRRLRAECVLVGERRFKLAKIHAGRG